MDGKLDSILKELDDLYQNAPCGYHSLDSNGFFLKINDTELGWLGLSRDEVVGRLRLPDIVFPEDRPISMRAFESLLRGETVSDLEVRLLRRDGTPLSVLVNANALRDESGNFMMSRSVLTDISRQKKAEKALHALLENAEKSRAIISGIPNGILLLDQDGAIFDCNPGAERILGMTMSNIVGRPFRQIAGNFIREDGSSFPEKELPPVVTQETGEPCSDIVMGLPIMDDGTTWIRLDCKVLTSREQPFAIMVSFSDISERKKQREALQQSYAALRELSFRLEHAREVERANIAREIHDELGSTLTSIKFDLSWATEKNGDRARFEEIFRGLDAAIRRVKKICTALRPSILDDLGLLAAIEWQLQQFGKKTGIRCRLDAGESEPELPQDVATGIFRIFQETLTNVARHAEASSVLVEFHSDDKDILLTVTDDGKGIGPKGKNSKSLGIIGMNERAQALGGALSVRPARPRGTRVTLSVPLERRTSDRISAASNP